MTSARIKGTRGVRGGGTLQEREVRRTGMRARENPTTAATMLLPAPVRARPTCTAVGKLRVGPSEASLYPITAAGKVLLCLVLSRNAGCHPGRLGRAGRDEGCSTERVGGCHCA